jgi:hypothetical protein
VTLVDFGTNPPGFGPEVAARNPLLVSGGVLDEERSLLLGDLTGRIRKFRRRNAMLDAYYDGKKQVRSLGIAVSPEFDKLETVCGWGSTVVDRFNERRLLDQIVVPDSTDLSDAVQAIYDYNEFDSEIPMALTDEGVQGISFLVVSDNPEAEEALIHSVPASRMTMDYSRQLRRGTAAGSIDPPENRYEQETHTLYLPDETIVCSKGRGGKYVVLDRYPNPSGLLPVVRMVNNPRHNKPWGRTRITPAVRSLVDAVVRTMVSMEVAREFFAAPMRFALNIDPEAFEDDEGNKIPAWETYWGRFLALSAQEFENGEPGPEPDLKQLPASSPAPLTDLVKMYSQLITSETGMPPSMWGFVTENPPSGDGARMYENTLVVGARRANTIDGVAIAKAMNLGLLGMGLVTPDEYLRLRTKCDWANPATHTVASITDAVGKDIQNGVLVPDSDVTLRLLDFDRETRREILADQRRAKARAMREQLTAQAAIARQNPEAVSIADRRASADDRATESVPEG